MSDVKSSYRSDRPRGESGSASGLKARFENMAKVEEEVGCQNKFSCIELSCQNRIFKLKRQGNSSGQFGYLTL